MRRRVTFSRNLTLSLSRTCRCYCKYCAFKTHQAHLHDPDEVLEILDQAVERHRVKELLVLTGEKPEVNAGVKARLGEYGWGGAASTHYWVSPKDRIVVVTMEQTFPYTFDTEFAVKGLIYDALVER